MRICVEWLKRLVIKKGTVITKYSTLVKKNSVSDKCVVDLTFNK